MNYTLIRLDHLDKHNATQIEANIEAVTFAELDSAKETGSRLASVTRDLHRGDIFLITDAPRTPLFASTNGSLELTESHSVTMSSEAIQKAKQRIIPANQAVANAGRSSFTDTSSENLQPADESTTVTQEDTAPHQRDDRTRYYYNIEIACPASKAATYAPGTFNLGPTDNEPKQGLTLKSTAIENAWYSAECMCDEPKKLFYKPNGSADSNLGIQPVKLSTTCAVREAKEAYIPVTPAVQVNERLGFPTKGYFYHFHGNVLIHEYKIQEGKCTFEITHSRSEHIDDSVKFTKSQHSILLFWRINGKIVNNQYLLYKKEQLTTTDLTEMTEDWLQENGFEVDVAALQDARSEPMATSAVEDLPAVAPKKVQHYENIWYKYPKNEIAPNVLAAKKGSQPFDIAVCNLCSCCPYCGNTGICKVNIDYDFIAAREGKLKVNGYVPDPKNSHSGVTISSGVDLGCRNIHDLKRLGLSQELITKLSPYLLKTKHEAISFLKEHPLTISEDEALDLYLKVKREINAKLIKRYNDGSKTSLRFECLPQEAQTVIASVYYQYQNRVLKYKFWKHACKQDWSSTYNELMNFSDSYPSRREIEAHLLKVIL